MDTHGCALMDVDGYEYIHGWIWVDVGKCVSKNVFQKMSQLRGPIEMDRDGYAWMDMDGRRHMHFLKITKRKAQRPPRAVELSFL